jgi:PAS domain S-box-containing protein
VNAVEAPRAQVQGFSVADEERHLARHAIDAATWELDLATGRVRVSARLARMLGGLEEACEMPREQWLGRIAEKDRCRMELELEAMAAGISESFDTRCCLREPTGSARLLRVKGLLQRGPGGVPAAVGGFVKDVSGRERTEQALRETEARDRSLFEASPEAMAVHRDGRLLLVNQRLADLLGFREGDDLRGRLLLELVHAPDRSPMLRDLGLLLRGAAGSLSEVRLLRRDGTAVTVEVSSRRIAFEGAAAFLAVARDATERRRREERLSRASRLEGVETVAGGLAEQLDAALGALDTNLRGVSERLPVLAGRADTIGARIQAPGQIPALPQLVTLGAVQLCAEEALAGVARLRSTVGALEDLCRPGDRPRHAVAVPRALEQALCAVEHEMGPFFRFKKEIGEVPAVLAEETSLRRLFEYLLLDSVMAFDPSTSLDPTIEIAIWTEDGEVIAQVGHPGCGLASETPARFSAPFLAARPAGAGLGLSISWRIVESLGGRFEVESQLGRNTAVRVRLPAFAEPAPSRGDDLPARSSPRGELIDEQLGAYRVLRRLEAGGMAEIYLADDTRLGRRVALKILPRELAERPEKVEQFQREARIVSALNHPNILTVYDVGRVGDIHYLATEYVPGETLRARMARGEIQLQEIVDVGIQAAGALQAAHEAGIVHQDIKPENLILRPDGLLKVLDFGIALQAEDAISPRGRAVDGGLPPGLAADTLPELVLGTPEYMSPEQVQGLVLDRRTDLFSLGVVLYELATGRVPFQGFTPGEVVRSILACEPAHPSCLAPGMPRKLVQILLKALRKEPPARYQAAAEMLSDLCALREELEDAPALRQSSLGVTPLAPSPIARETVASRPRLLAGEQRPAEGGGAWSWGSFRRRLSAEEAPVPREAPPQPGLRRVRSSA